MAKSPADLAAIMATLLGESTVASVLDGSWSGQKIGFVDPSLWTFSPVICDPDPVLIEQQRAEMDAALKKIGESGGHVVRDVPLTSMDELVLDSEDALEQLWSTCVPRYPRCYANYLSDHDFAKAWAEYLKGYENAGIKNLEDMIRFNKEHADVELPTSKSKMASSALLYCLMTMPTGYPGQQLLELAVKDTMSDEKYKDGVKICREAARVNGIDKTLADYNLDVILGPMDGRIPTIAAAAGYPVGTMPLGYSKTNGRPFGMCIIASAGQEDKILKAMSAWEATMGKRVPPPQMVEDGSGQQPLASAL